MSKLKLTLDFSCVKYAISDVSLSLAPTPSILQIPVKYVCVALNSLTCSTVNALITESVFNSFTLNTRNTEFVFAVLVSTLICLTALSYLYGLVEL